MPDEDDECIHGLGPISACTICNGRDREEAKLVPDGPPFIAQFAGRCAACQKDIEPGDLIGRFTRGSYGCQTCWTSRA